MVTQRNFIKVKTPGWQTELAKFLRFLLVGFSSTLLDFGVLTLLKNVGWATLPANLVSYSCGTLNSYLLSRFWLYRQIDRRQRLVQLIQFLLVSLIGLGLNNGLVLALEGPAGQLLNNPAQGYLPAKGVATTLVMGWNYLANRLWTFGKREPVPTVRTAAQPIADERYDQQAA